MAGKKSTAIEKTSDEEREAAALAECSDFFDNVEVDGLEEVDGEDIKIAVRLWNMSGLDKNGKQYPRDAFFDTVSEDVREEIECVFLLTRKSKRYDVYDNDKKETDIFCQSNDRITGVTNKHPDHKPDTARACLKCPDDGWFRDAKGKPYRKCGEVHTVVAIERGTQKPFLIRFKKTALKAFRNYLMAHHVGGRVSANERKNIPLFVYSCGIKLSMHESGNYALPVLTRGAQLDMDQMTAMYEQAKDYLAIMDGVIAHADKQDDKHTTGERDETISADDFKDEGNE